MKPPHKYVVKSQLIEFWVPINFPEYSLTAPNVLL